VAVATVEHASTCGALEEPGETGAAAMATAGPAMVAEAAGEGGVAGEAAALAKSQNEASKGPVAPPAVIPLTGLSQSITETNRIQFVVFGT
jgi:hypothetical protein